MAWKREAIVGDVNIVVVYDDTPLVLWYPLDFIRAGHACMAFPFQRTRLIPAQPTLNIFEYYQSRHT